MSDKNNVKLKPKPKTHMAKPRKWAVVALNDDFTPADFVAFLLVNYFNKSYVDAAMLVADIHKKGKGVAGVYPLEVAETKVSTIALICKNNDHPLRMVIEPS